MTLKDKESEAAVKALTAAGDYKGLTALLEERTNSPKFRKLLKKRDNLYQESVKLDSGLDVAKGYVKDSTGVKKTSFVAVREATLKSREVQEKLSAATGALDQYRAINALIALNASTMRENNEKAAGTFLSYDADTIGDLINLGSYETGSPQWHEERRSGIGGSDVSKIMKTDPKYAASDYREVLLTKLNLLSDNESEEYRDNLATAVGRGNAWEEHIRHMYADKHPDKNVAFCKTSWGGEGDRAHNHANFDGLILDNNFQPEAVIEIKTGITTSSWGNTTDGIFGAPENYRKQVLWYAMNANLKWGAIVAVLDDHDYREYNFNMTDPKVQEECQKIREETDKFWTMINQKKAELKKGIDSVSSTRRKGFAKTLNMKKSAQSISAYSGENFDETYAKVREAFSKIKKEGQSYTAGEIQDTLTKLYAAHDPNTRKVPLIGIDIETNHAAVKKGRIIETGIVRLNVDGTIDTLFSSVHGVPDITMEGLGVGDTSIHRITEDMIVGVEPFENETTQHDILKFLKSGVVVAHNASFEDRFLTVNLAGYAEARDAGEIVIFDTKDLITRLMLDSDNNSLESFAEDNGIPYVGAHAALADAIMMMEAFRKFQEKLFKKGKFVNSRSTKRARAKAERETVTAENNR